MSRAQRDKGARGEREVIQLLKDHGWPNARRTSDGRAQSSRGDITAGPSCAHIEVKYVERLSVPQAVRQAQADAHPHDIPIVAHRSSRQQWLATLPLEDLLPLLALREGGLR